ncbi:MAG: DUF2490 domain-containing protein [Pseudomonadota bacterium]
MFIKCKFTLRAGLAISLKLATPSLLEAHEAPEPPSGASRDLSISAIGTSVVANLLGDFRGNLFLMRFGEVDTTLLQVDLTRKLHTQVSVGGTYILLRPDDGANQNTVRLHVDLHHRGGAFSVDARNSLEHRIASDEVAKRTRIRSRLRATYHGKAGGSPFSIYATAEPHYNITRRQWTKTNFRIGARLSVNKTTSLDLSYFLSDSRRDIDIVAISLLFKL